MHKLYGIAFQRVLKYFNKEKITFENIKELMKEKNIQPTHQIIFHRLPRQDCKDFVKTPCPISSAEETNSEIVQISKRLRSQFKALQSKVCNRCPFKDQCQKKYLEPTFVSQDTTKDLLLFMSKMAEYQKLDFVNYKTWNGGYKIADSVISMLQDLSQGGKVLKQYQRLRSEQIQKSDQMKKENGQLEKKTESAIKEARKKRVPLQQSHIRVSTSTFQDISMGKLNKFTKKIDEDKEQEDTENDGFDFTKKKSKKSNKQQQVDRQLQEDEEDEIDVKYQEKSFKKKPYQNKDRSQRGQRSQGYRNNNKFDSQRGGYNRQNKFQKSRSEGYQKRQSYNKSDNYGKGYENKDRPQRTWQKRDNQKGEERGERGAYKSNFNNQRQYGGKRQSYGDQTTRKFNNNNNYQNNPSGQRSQRSERGYGQKRSYQNNDRQYNNNRSDRTDRPQRTYNNKERYGQRSNNQRSEGKYQREQRDRPARGRNNFEQNQYNDPAIRRVSKAPINPYEKKGDFSLNDLQKKQSAKPFEQRFNIKQSEYTKYERIPDELRTPQTPKKSPVAPTETSQQKTERKGRRVKNPTIITQ